MLERSEERAARVDGVVEVSRLEREEEPQVRVLSCDLSRLCGEASGLGDSGRVPGASTLHERERSRDHREDERDTDDGEQDPQAACPALSAPELALLRVPARVEELAFDL